MNKVKDLSFIEMLKQVLTGERECLHIPEGEVEIGEVVLGVLENPIARSLFSFRAELAHSAKKFADSLPEERPTDKAKRIELLIKFTKVRSRSQIIGELFWEAVYSDFPEARNPDVSLGIREGWKVVIFKSQRSPFQDLFDILGG